MIPYYLRKIWQPEIFQGHIKKKKYYEGWYFKLVDNQEENIISIIPGISLGDSENPPHSFIQIMDGKNGETEYLKFNNKAFSYSKKRFEIAIENNYFSINTLKLNIQQENISIKGQLYFKNTITWPSTFFSPGIMGWYGFIPFMECYHDVLSLDNDIEGQLEIDGKLIDFNKGKGYLEKDWGVSFPKEWVWLQSNHFASNRISLTCSIAIIPWINREFTGFICGLYWNKRLYKFSTYNGSSIKKAEKKSNGFLISLANKEHQIDIAVKKSHGGTLYSPKIGVMCGEIEESVTSEVTVSLYDIKRNQTIFCDVGRNCGLEIKGDILQDHKRISL